MAIEGIQKEPSLRVPEAVSLFQNAKASMILDLGFGTGRHAVYLTQNGFEVCGCDSSAAVLRIAKGILPEVEFQRCDVGWLPHQHRGIGDIFCHAVIQDGTVDTIEKTIAEIHRVLRRGAVLLLTVISTDHPEYLTGQEIEPGTKINVDAIDGICHTATSRSPK